MTTIAGNGADVHASAAAALGPQNPWPGLESFEENDSAYFYGREQEAQELQRLIKRELLTVLFGRSGLGKSSLLKAGLTPLLRAEGMLPVYVRLDFSAGGLGLREQILGELAATCKRHAVEAPASAAESLWSFFHLRTTEFWSADNRPVMPVIILDQFEEIFTLGQGSDLSRSRSEALLIELADWVENRQPAAVKEALERDPDASAGYDFQQSSGKLVLSFREDFLAHMEGVKHRMPSLMYNRFRLQPMSGHQAYAVITLAGHHLVDDEVARRVVRLAWKNEPEPPVEQSEFDGIEIEPALLSVVCSELNHKRLTLGLERIEPALLTGADREILAGFYERSMAGLDPGVREFVEDELITDQGFRDSYVLEDAAARVGHSALDTLITRRLLKVDERLNLRRVELMHDVLTRVVKESRDGRLARDAEAAAKRHERAALRQRRRTQRNAGLMLSGAVIAIGLMLLAGWSWWHTDRLRDEVAHFHLMKGADEMEDVSYDLSLLLNTEAARSEGALDATTALLGRLSSRPLLAAYLHGHADAVIDVAFSPDGQQIVSASDDHSLILWDTESRRQVGDPLKGQTGRVRGVAFSPLGRLIASASLDGRVILWDAETRKQLAELKGHSRGVRGVAFNRDGDRLATAGDDKTVILWNVQDRKQLRVLKGHDGAVNSVAFSPDGKRLASAGADAVIVWDVESGERLKALAQEKEFTDGVAFSGDGRWLAAGADHQVLVWDTQTYSDPRTLEGHENRVRSVAFSWEGDTLASASEDNTVRLWDVKGRKARDVLKGHKTGVRGLAFSRDGRNLASAGEDRAVILWRIDGNHSIRTLGGHGSPVNAVAFSADGKQLAAATGRAPSGRSPASAAAVVLWDVNEVKQIKSLHGHKDRINSVAFSSDGKLASASRDRTVILWNLETGTPLRIFDKHEGEVRSVAFSPDGRLLASASSDRSIRLWDATSGALQRTIKDAHKRRVHTVAFSPDGKLLASGGDDRSDQRENPADGLTIHSILVWDVESGARAGPPLEKHTDEVHAIAFSADGRRLASASEDRDVILWNLDSRKPIAVLPGHGDEVRGIAFGLGGRVMASSSVDSDVILWSTEKLVVGDRLLARMRGRNKFRLHGIAFSPDGGRMASASSDGTVKLWTLDVPPLVGEACARANRNLTCDEWRSFLEFRGPYRKTCDAFPAPTVCK